MLGAVRVLYQQLKRPLCIGFSGAGGKTSSLYALAGELINIHEYVLITTTTKMFPAENNRNIEIVIRETINKNEVNSNFACQWFSKIDSEGKGVSPKIENIEKVNKYANIWKLIEIDGSRHLPIKAPGAGEPVYCQGLDLVFGVIGAGVFGKSISGELVHRLERFLEVTQTQVGDAMTPEVIARLINSPNGLFQGLPEGVEARVLFSAVRPEDAAFIEKVQTMTDTAIEVNPWRDK